jgi:hypothetical protein
MNHVYVFGSLVRGDYDNYSDIDLLALVSSYNEKYDINKFSIYSYNRIKELWNQGNPFAWHLSIESKLIYSSDGKDFIAELGSPSDYKNAAHDCNKFLTLYLDSKRSLLNNTNSVVFEISNIFLAIRNFSTCFALSRGENIFSRDSSKLLGKNSLNISESTYDILVRARILSTRGTGTILSDSEIQKVKTSLAHIDSWFNSLNMEIDNGRI